nr:metal ABC transporter substrate-binding protein [Corynebacterium kutscheri]
MLAVSCLALSACSTPNAQADDQINVVASTTQICDYVKQLNLDDVDLTCLLAPNASAHDHEMTHEQLTKLSKADLMLVNGVDLEHFLDDAVESSGFKGTMVVTTGVLTGEEVEGTVNDGDLPYTIDRGIAKVAVEKWPFAPEPGEVAEFTYDPHVWTTPRNAKIQVGNIGNALKNATDNEETKKDIDAAVDLYQKQLQELDDWAAESIASVKDPVLFTSHDAFGYFSAAYGVNFVGAALSDFNEQQDATASHIAEAAETVRASGATALFAENSNNSKSIEAIAKAAGVKAIVGEDALYGDSLGPAGSEGETYVGSIIHNIETVVDAWGGTLAPLPASL